MFDLEKEVDAWCRSVHSKGWRIESLVSELKDHLYCEIERLCEEGFGEEKAFHAAVERLGKSENLRREHAKIRTRWSVVLELLMNRIDVSADEDALNESRSSLAKLLPTLFLAVGLLIGGLIGATLGAFSGNESITIACYVIGVLAGSTAGGFFGRRFQARRKNDPATLERG